MMRQRTSMQKNLYSLANQETRVSNKSHARTYSEREPYLIAHKWCDESEFGLQFWKKKRSPEMIAALQAISLNVKEIHSEYSKESIAMFDAFVADQRKEVNRKQKEDLLS